MATTKKPAAKKKAASPKSAAKASKAPAKAKPKSEGKKSSPETYTDPALRDKLKAEVMAGDKGGKPDQWSARKSQLLAAEYKKAGGGYKATKGKKAEPQEHLDEWTDQKWKTADGEPAIRDGETARYLPEKAWDELTPAQKKATDAKKKAGSRQGRQFVPNTKAAKKARKEA